MSVERTEEELELLRKAGDLDWVARERIRENLALTVLERIRKHEANAKSVLALRNAKRQPRPSKGS